MDISVTGVLGVVFLGLSILTTYLMFQFWGYPYDEERKKSSCPQWKMNIHRGCGFAYGAVYLVMMAEMVPRMWQYQVELPARTVAHIMLGITIGVLLLVKVSILRWFRHFEEWMPFLGVALMLCTFLLSGLSLPFVAKERALASIAAVGGSAFSDENRTRVRGLLERAGLPEPTDLDGLATKHSLERGRSILLGKCVFCHDLKTAIARPRTPANWARTVVRMAEKPTLGEAIDAKEQAEVSAYLIAITPNLQTSAKQKREQAMERSKSVEAAENMAAPPDGDAGPGDVVVAATPTDPAKAKAVYEELCSQCHDLSDVDDEPPGTREEAVELVQRMVEDNDMEADAESLELVTWYLIETYVKTGTGSSL